MRSRSERVVVVRLQSGLGNQLFQVSAGLLVARRNRCPLVVERELIGAEPFRSYALADWDLPIGQVLPGWVRSVVEAYPGLGLGPFGDAVSRSEDLPGTGSRWRRPAAHVQEGRLGFQPLLFEARAPCVLSGYWQAWQHVDPVLPLVRATAARIRLSGELRAEASALRSRGAIAVHVRRGDFVGAGARTFGAVPATYVHEAVALLRQRLGHRPVRIFSDDVAWCSEHLGGLEDTTIPVEPGTADEDLLLMAACRAHVVSNSTFAWWGATLARSELVVAPDPWFRDPSVLNRDLVWPHWLRLPTTLGD